VIQHTVMWKLVELTDTERDAAIDRFRQDLSALVGVVPGPDVRDVESNFDVALISIHESREALATYQSHPAHVAVGTWWGSLVTQRGAVDSEI